MNNRRWIIFSISVSLFLISLFYRVSSAIIAVDLSRDLNLKAQDLGLLGAAFFYSFALIQIPLGLILDRIGARMTMFVLNIIDSKEIKKAFDDENFKEKVKNCKSPYGDGKAGVRIADILSRIKIDKKLLQKRLTY